MYLHPSQHSGCAVVFWILQNGLTNVAQKFSDQWLNHFLVIQCPLAEYAYDVLGTDCTPIFMCMCTHKLL
jgi:hypothetical protein